MASIFKRGSVWWIHYYVGGKPVNRSLRTTEQRVALDKKQRLEAFEITDQLAAPSNTPIRACVQSFCDYLGRTQTHKGYKNDVSYLRGFFGCCCPALQLGSHVPHKFRHNVRQLPMIKDQHLDRHVPVSRLEQINSEMVASYIRQRMVEDGIGPKTANRIREVLRRLFNYAIDHHGYVCPDRRCRNPVAPVRRVQESAPQITWLGAEQIDQQLKVLENHPVIQAMVAVYVYAGLRREEAMWLTASDVDLDARLIRVRAKEIEGKAWQPKTRRNRVVPISEALLKILRAYQPPVASTWYFPTAAGRRWDPDTFSQDLREINEGAGVHWTCLDFRHTFGSQLAQKGESLYKIATLMGKPS